MEYSCSRVGYFQQEKGRVSKEGHGTIDFVRVRGMYSDIAWESNNLDKSDAIVTKVALLIIGSNNRPTTYASSDFENLFRRYQLELPSSPPLTNGDVRILFTNRQLSWVLLYCLSWSTRSCMKRPTKSRQTRKHVDLIRSLIKFPLYVGFPLYL